MNKIMFIATNIVIVVVLFAFISTPTLATGNVSSHTEVSKNDLKERIESLNSKVDLRYSEEVHTIINTYIKKYRKGSERLLGLSEQFFPLYEAEFHKQGLPHELKYLSIVESGLRPEAVSVSGAVGLWQFMKGTGQNYGLRINSTVDERRDPIKSTQAASRYLKDLYLSFDDWTLALAAYNCGPGNVRKALRHSNEEEFWSLKGRGYLPRETRRYIPKYVAISYLMNYSHVHNLHPEYSDVANTLATVSIYDYVTFSQISKITGLSKSTIGIYNPSYLKGYIPKSSKGYYLTLPQTDLYYFLSQVGGFENLLDLGYDSSTLKGRYLLFGAMKSKIAKLSLLPVQNSVFKIDITEQSPFDHPVKLPFTMTPLTLKMEKRRDRSYKLKPYESLFDVARERKIKLADLIKINNIDPAFPPPPGSSIQLE